MYLDTTLLFTQRARCRCRFCCYWYCIYIVTVVVAVYSLLHFAALHALSYTTPTHRRRRVLFLVNSMALFHTHTYIPANTTVFWLRGRKKESQLPLSVNSAGPGTTAREERQTATEFTLRWPKLRCLAVQSLMLCGCCNRLRRSHVWDAFVVVKL